LNLSNLLNLGRRACVLLVLLTVTAAGVARAAAADGGDVASPLMTAVKSGNHDLVRTLLGKPVDVNAPEVDGTTALHWSVRGNDLETTRLLLGAGARADQANRYGVTPLSLAALNGNGQVMEALIKAGADPSGSVSDGQTMVMIAARSGNPDAIGVLLARHVDVNARERVLGETALIWAASENHAEAVTLLAKNGADLNARSNPLTFPLAKYGDGKSARFTVLPRGGWTPLMYAARQGATNAARALAETGANLNLTDPDGTSALVLAIINAHYDLAAMLIDKGADANVVDTSGMAALYAAVDMNTLDETPGRPAPKSTDRLSAVDLVARLLDRGANPNAQLAAPLIERVHNNGDAALGAGATPLMRAAKKGDLAIMRVLLDRGADVNVAMKNGATALMFVSGRGGLGRFGVYDAKRASEAEFVEAAKLCLQHGAKVNVIDAAGQTAMHSAAAQRGDAFIEFLADNGARLDLKDKQGRLPLDMALGAGARGEQTVRESAAALLRKRMNLP
jgi:ankyrin repeat protein